MQVEQPGGRGEHSQSSHHHPCAAAVRVKDTEPRSSSAVAAGPTCSSATRTSRSTWLRKVGQLVHQSLSAGLVKIATWPMAPLTARALHQASVTRAWPPAIAAHRSVAAAPAAPRPARSRTPSSRPAAVHPAQGLRPVVGRQWWRPLVRPADTFLTAPRSAPERASPGTGLRHRRATPSLLHSLNGQLRFLGVSKGNAARG